MPFFKKKDTKKEEAAKSGYPGQGSSSSGYPTAPQSQGAAGTAAPPPYAPPGQVPQASGYAPPPQGYAPPPQGYAPPPQGYAPPPQGYGAPPQGYGPPPQYYSGQPQTMVVQGAQFDAGARFDGVAQPNIPPPPPGCAPNAAQMAASQGHSVVMSQANSDFMSGGSGGGYCVW